MRPRPWREAILMWGGLFLGAGLSVVHLFTPLPDVVQLSAGGVAFAMILTGYYLFQAYDRRNLARRWRHARGQCVRCGYDLRGGLGRCPECGRRVPRGNRNVPAGQPTIRLP